MFTLLKYTFKMSGSSLYYRWLTVSKGSCWLHEKSDCSGTVVQETTITHPFIQSIIELIDSPFIHPFIQLSHCSEAFKIIHKKKVQFLLLRTTQSSGADTMLKIAIICWACIFVVSGKKKKSSWWRESRNPCLSMVSVIFIKGLPNPKGKVTLFRLKKFHAYVGWYQELGIFILSTGL